MGSTALLILVAVLSAFNGVFGRSWTIPLKSTATNNTRWRVSNPERKPSSAGVNIPLTDWFDRSDNQWYSNISIGSPPQNITVLWDTGSNTLLFPGSNCTTCGTHSLFNPDRSSTFSTIPDNEVSVYFSTGADSIPFTEPEGARGIIAFDTVAIGGLSYADQGFMLCDEYAPALDAMPIDGIIGLSPFNASSIGEPPFLWNLWKSGQLDSPLFSLYTPAGDVDGAELTLGGIDASRYAGELAYLDINQDRTQFLGGWVLEQSALYVGGGPALPGPAGQRTRYALLDTGTAFVQAPDFATARDLYARVSPAIRQIDDAGAWGAPCDEVDRAAADFVFTLLSSSSSSSSAGAGTPQLNVTLPRSAFNLGEYPGQPGICQAVFNHNVLESASFWILGSPLLKAYYTVWDGLHRRVGWAQLRGEETCPCQAG